jgi:cobalt-zinc-cadmium efflux system outer membrane protein
MPNWIRPNLLFSAWSSLLLAGCVSYHPQPISPEKSAAEFESRTLLDSGLKAYLEKNTSHEITPWPPESWDAQTLTLAAFYYNPDLDLARAKAGVARAGVITAGEHPNPTLSFAPGRNTTTSGASPWIITSALDFPIETANKRGYRLAKARHDAQSAQANILSTAWDVRTRLLRTLLDQIGSTRTVEILKRQQSSQEEIVRLLELQLRQPNAGITAQQVTQARITLRGTRLAVLEAERQRVEAQAHLAQAVGIPLAALRDIPVAFDLSTELPNAMASDEARRQALLTRADVLGALADYEATQNTLQLEIAKQYPDINLGPGYEYDQGDNKWSLGLSLTLPILNQNRGAIAEAQAKRTEAAIHFTSLQAKVIGEIDTALSNYSTARRRLETTQELQADIDKQRKAAQSLFDAGEISRMELIGLQLELQTSEQASLEATVKAHQAINDVEGALQRPLDVPQAALLDNPRRQPADHTSSHGANTK